MSKQKRFKKTKANEQRFSVDQSKSETLFDFSKYRELIDKKAEKDVGSQPNDAKFNGNTAKHHD